MARRGGGRAAGGAGKRLGNAEVRAGRCEGAVTEGKSRPQRHGSLKSNSRKV